MPCGHPRTFIKLSLVRFAFGSLAGSKSGGKYLWREPMVRYRRAGGELSDKHN